MGVPKKRTSSVTIMRYYYVNRCECLFGKWTTFTVREARHNMSLFMCPFLGWLEFLCVWMCIFSIFNLIRFTLTLTNPGRALSRTHFFGRRLFRWFTFIHRLIWTMIGVEHITIEIKSSEIIVTWLIGLCNAIYCIDTNFRIDFRVAELNFEIETDTK